MGLTFYYHPLSPPCRIVMLTLEELGNVDCQKHLFDMQKRDYKDDWYLKINPQGKMPAIKDGDLVLTQSCAIALYLCKKYGDTSNNKNLYPNDNTIQTKINESIFFNLECHATFVAYSNYPDIFHKGATSHNLDLLPKVKTYLDTYERLLQTQNYMAASFLTIADFVALTELELLDHADFQEWENYPNLMKWQKRMEGLPYYKSTHLEGKKIFYDAVKAKLQANFEQKNEN